MELFIALLLLGVVYYLLSKLFRRRKSSAYQRPPSLQEASQSLPCGPTGWWLLNGLFAEGRISAELFRCLSNHPLTEIRSILLERELISFEDWEEYQEQATFLAQSEEFAEGVQDDQ